MTFREIEPSAFEKNAIKLIGKDWMLITAGEKEKYNMMTASWGGIGHLWQKPVCFIFVRPTRYTYQFMEDNDFFSINFFIEKYRDILNFCGTKSGRDVNKMEETELTPISELNTIYFEEAKLTLLCKKVYYHDIKPDNFLDLSIADLYPQQNYHRMYIGEILKCYMKEK
ncbi:MAG: flavin reductase family protein [Asgard group archaeon]|nr:flavin reductase family protein [Asgard group archaeon]